MKILQIILILLTFSSSVWAECDISNFDINNMREVHNRFKNESNLKNAESFFKSIPVRFCEFNEIYGYPRDKAGPLYELDLHETLPKLESFIAAEELISKYVALASEAKWEADSVSYLQHSYYELFLNKPNLVINEIMNLPETKRKTAISFIFDGPHPSNKILHSDKKKNICAINQQFCIELNQVEKELLLNEHKH